MKDGLVDRAEVLRIIQEARESGETDLRSIRALVEYLPAATPPTTPSAAAMRAAEELQRENLLLADTTLEELSEVAAIITRHLPADGLVDEVQRRMDQVAEAAVEWHQAGREGREWFEAAEKLGAAIDSLLELRSKPNVATSLETDTEHERLRRTFAYERVRFHHDPNSVYLVVNVTDDNMLELEGMAGEFAPSLFKRVGNKDTTPFVTPTAAANTSPETPVGGHQCVKCGHFETVDLHDEGECQIRGQSGFICGCKCEFTAPVQAAGDDEDKSNYYWHGPREDKK